MKFFSCVVFVCLWNVHVFAADIQMDTMVDAVADISTEKVTEESGNIENTDIEDKEITVTDEDLLYHAWKYIDGEKKKKVWSDWQNLPEDSRPEWEAYRTTYIDEMSSDDMDVLIQKIKKDKRQSGTKAIHPAASLPKHVKKKDEKNEGGLLRKWYNKFTQ